MKKQGVIILGAGGHGQVVLDILLARSANGGDVRVLGFLDDDQSRWETAVLGVPILGPINALPHFEHDGVVVAIGNNKARAQLTSTLLAAGARLTSAIHPSAILGRAVHIGDGTMIAAGAIVNIGAHVGAGVIVNTAAVVEHHCRIGSYSHIAPGVRLGGEVVVGDGVLVGLGALVLPGRRIADWAVVGAGAVVTADVPSGWTVAGVPARRLAQDRSR